VSVGKRLVPVLLIASAALGACSSPARGTSVATTPVTSPAASATQPTTPTSSPAPAKPAPSPSPAKPKISKAGLDYFFAIALGAEYGDKLSVVTRWTEPQVTVRVHGSARKSRSCLNKVISDFNALTRTTDLKLTTSPADIELYFAPLSRFRSIEPAYVSGNDGFFSMHYSDAYAITSANVLIRSSGIGAGIRCHLIREELTQTMGLARDSGKYPGSVFYGKYHPAPTRYSTLDKEIIRLLYRGVIRPGDDRKAVTKAVTVK
jgi:hypothetical protein